MDADRFDHLTRRLTAPTSSRRLVLAAPVALLAANTALSEDASARKRCPTTKRCGKDRCKAASCFPKKIDPFTEETLSFGCCSATKLCLDPNGDSDHDQCCYADETCNPNGDNSGNGLCCRACKGTCCRSAQQCKNGKCVDLNTARLPRRRP